MKKFLLALGAGLLSVTTLLGQADTVTLANGTAGTPAYNAGPIYRSSSTSTYYASRYAYLYTPTEMAANGITAGVITHIGWKKDNTAEANYPGSLKIYMKNSSASSYGSATEDWVNLNTGTTLVYDAQVTISNTTDYIYFQLSTPFIYTGGSLEVMTEWDFSGASSPASTGAFDWEWETVTDRIYGVGQSSTTSTGFGTLSSTSNSISAIDDRRPLASVVYNPPTGTDGTVNGLNLASFTTFCPGDTTVSVNLVNVGGNDITAATIGWAVNGVPQTSVNVTSTISTGGSVNVDLGSYTFAAGQTYDIDVYISSLTSSAADANASNDTVSLENFITSMTGVYTVNSAAPTAGSNFNSFADLITALNQIGMCGSVTVNVSGGPYNERVVIGQITGLDATNTLTINGNGAEITHAATVSAERATFLLDGADYVTINNLVIKATGTYGFALQLTNAADHNVISNNTLISDTVSTSSTNFAGLVMSGSLTSPTSGGNNGNYNRIEGNTIIGGYYGIVSYGSSSSTSCMGNEFLNNSVQDFYAYGIRTTYQDSARVIGNDISRPFRTNFTTTYGIYNSYTYYHSVVADNWVHNVFDQGSSSTSTFYGIYATTADAAAGEESVVYNNLISDIYNNGAHYLFYNSGSDGWHYYHNTAVTADKTSSPTGVTRGFYQTSEATNLVFKNNLITIIRGGTGTQHAVYLNTSSTTADINNNGYYVDGAGTVADRYIGYHNSTDYADIAGWQTANSGAYDAASQFGDPFFVDLSGQDYHPQTGVLNDIGADVLSIVPTDRDGVARTTTPDPGAYEFTPPPGPDLLITHLLTQDPSSCSGSNQVSVVLLNIGSDTATALTLTWEINSAAQTSVPVTTILAPGASDTVVLGMVSGMTAFTDYVVDVTITAVGPGSESDVSNNSGQVTLRMGLSGNVTIDAAGTPSGTVFTSLTAFAEILNAYGVCGPVTATVAPNSGTYYGPVIFNEIAGASATNTITILGNGNTVEHTSSNTAERGTFMLLGTDYLTIDSLNIVALGAASGEYGMAVHMYGGTDHNTFTNNTFTANITSNSSNFACVGISASLTSATTTGLTGSYNHFEGNTFTGGYYGLTLAGGSSDVNTNNTVVDNVFQDFYLYSVYPVNQKELLVADNDISRANRTTASTFYGIYSSGNDGVITGNRVHNNADMDLGSTSTAYGMYFTGDPDPGKFLTVTNNMVYKLNSSGTIYGVYNTGADRVRMLNNTIVISETAANTTSTYYTRGFYQTTTANGLEFKNNILWLERDPSFQNTVVYLNTTGTDIEMDNNVYFSTAASTADLGYYSGAQTNLSAWQSASGKDANSQEINPLLTDVAADDLTPQANAIDGMAISFPTEVATDINGVARGAMPDPGALEFTPVTCTGVSGFSMYSVGGDSITLAWNGTGNGVIIEWGPVGFTTGTQTVNVSSSDTSVTLPGLQELNCYDFYLTEDCAGSIPGTPATQGPLTICTGCLTGGLTGLYTVGGPGADFPDLDSVAYRLNSCGVSGPVTFHLASGTYNEQMYLDGVSGVSATNTITFEPDPANTTPVVVEFDATSSANYVFGFHDMSYVTVRGITLNALGSTYARVIDLTGEGSNIVIENNILNGKPAANSSSHNVTVITTTSGGGNNYNNCRIANNEINGGSFGVYLNGNGVSSQETGNVVDSNTVTDYSWSGISINAQSGALVRGNIVRSQNAYTTGYGIYSEDNTGLQVIGNQVVAYGTGDAYGLYVSGDEGTSTAPNMFINNMVSALSATDEAYGMYLYNSSYIRAYNNSFFIDGGSAANGRALYVNTSSTTTYGNNELINNNFISKGPGVAVEFNSTAATGGYVTTQNYNNFYGLSAELGRFGTTSAADLAAWQTASGLDANSVSGDPVYAAPDDLHAYAAASDNTGTPLAAVTTDIDGDARSATTPDIGADEYTQLPGDLALVGAIFDRNSYCLTSNDTIILYVQNLISPVDFGTTALTAEYSVTGPVNSSGTLVQNTGTLAPQDTLEMKAINIDLSIPGTYVLNAYLQPNAENVDTSNDTLVSVTLVVDTLLQAFPSNPVIVSNLVDSVEIEAVSPYFEGGEFFITEICHYRGSSTGDPSGGWPTYLIADDYIEVTGVPGSDMEGITLEQWTTSLQSSYTFPAGTVIGPNGTAVIAVGQMGSSTPSPADFYYHGNGSFSGTFSSTGSAGRILRRADGTIMDAVGYGTTYSFPAAAGVTTADWSGGTPAQSSAGNKLEGPDDNTGTYWVNSSSSEQDPNTVNVGVTVPAPPVTLPFDWTLNTTVVSNDVRTYVGPFPGPGTYNYVATLTTPCGVVTDTVVIIVPNCLAPTNLSGEALSISAAQVEWDTTGLGSASTYEIQYGPIGFTPGSGTAATVTGDNHTVVGGLAANLCQEYYVRKVCGATEFSPWVGPIVICPEEELCDNMDVYAVGPVDGQSSLFIEWQGAGGDGAFNSTQSVSSPNALYITDGGPATFSDIVAYFDTISTGAWDVAFDMYVPTGKAAYFNLQQNHDPTGADNQWGSEVYFVASGDMELELDDVVAGTFAYQHNQWFTINMIIDITNDTVWYEYNGASTGLGHPLSFENPAEDLQFNGVNFYSGVRTGDSAEFWVDDFCITPYTPPTCPAPSAITALNIGCDEVELDWTSGGAGDWQIEFGPDGFTPGSGTLENVLNKPYTLGGLAPSTDYDIYVRDSCAAGDVSTWAGPFSVTTAPAPVATASATWTLGTVTATDAQVNFNAGASVNATGYSWDFGNSTTGTGVTPTATYTANGVYNVTLTVTGDCGATDDTTFAVTVAGIGLEESGLVSLNIFPNPTAGQLRVSMLAGFGGEMSIRVTSALGQEMIRETWISGGGQEDRMINLSSHPAGIYFVTIQTEKGSVTRRVTKY